MLTGRWAGRASLALAGAHEPGDEDADFVEGIHRAAHEDEGDHVGGGGDDGGEDEDDDEGEGSCAAEEVVVHDAKLDEDEDDEGEFEREAEADDELGGEGVVFADGPCGLPAHGFGVLEKEFEGLGEDDEVAECHADEEEAEANRGDWVEHALLDRGEGGEDELGEEKKNEREGDDESAVEGEFQRNGERVCDTERLEVRGARGVYGDEGMLDERGELRAEHEAEGHRGGECDSDLDESGAEVFQMGEEGLGLVLALAEVKEAAHWGRE